MLARALVRAHVPAAFSGGFNPRIRLSVPLPRSVGTQSVVERFCAVLSTDEPIDCPAIQSRLGAHLPTGCTLQDVWVVDGKRTFQPLGAVYVFALSQPMTAIQHQHLSACINDLQTDRPITIQRYRTKTKSHQPFEISGFVETLCSSENTITVFCRVSRKGSVRIDELMQWLHLDVADLHEPVKRTAIQWEHNNQEQN